MGAITMMLDNPVSDPRSSQVFAPVLRTSATKQTLLPSLAVASSSASVYVCVFI